MSLSSASCSFWSQICFKSFQAQNNCAQFFWVCQTIDRTLFWETVNVQRWGIYRTVLTKQLTMNCFGRFDVQFEWFSVEFWFVTGQFWANHIPSNGGHNRLSIKCFETMLASTPSYFFLSCGVIQNLSFEALQEKALWGEVKASQHIYTYICVHM